MEQFKFNITDQQSNDIVFRTGEALPLVPPQKFSVTGDIYAPGSFIINRCADLEYLCQTVTPRSVLLVDKKQMLIKLLTDPEDLYAAEITGKLEMSDELKPFAINTSTTFNREQLVKLIRFNKLWFDTPEQHMRILAAYQSFNAKIQADIAQTNDNRSNKISSVQKRVETDLPETFILNVPLFKGITQRTRFMVEICFNTTETNTTFWFESPELHELFITERDKIIETEIEGIKNISPITAIINI